MSLESSCYALKNALRPSLRLKIPTYSILTLKKKLFCGEAISEESFLSENEEVVVLQGLDVMQERIGGQRNEASKGSHLILHPGLDLLSKKYPTPDYLVPNLTSSTWRCDWNFSSPSATLSSSLSFAHGERASRSLRSPLSHFTVTRPLTRNVFLSLSIVSNSGQLESDRYHIKKCFSVKSNHRFVLGK